MKKILLFCIALLFVIVGHSQVTYTWVKTDTIKYDRQWKWMAYGDSYTGGADNFRDQVNKYIVFSDVVDEGAGGDDIIDIHNRMIADTTADNTYYDDSDIFTIQFGYNDHAQQIDLDTIAWRLEKAIELVLTLNGELRLFVINASFRGDNPGGYTYKALADTIFRVCKDYGVPVIDWYGKSGINAINVADLIDGGGTGHPNAAGGVRLGDVVVDAFIYGGSSGGDLERFFTKTQGEITIRAEVDSLTIKGDQFFTDLDERSNVMILGGRENNNHGENNIGIGSLSLYELEFDGSHNMGIGQYSWANLEGGGWNVGVGGMTGRFMGANSTYNTAIGWHALYGSSLANLDYLVGIGAYAGRYADADYQIYIDNFNRSNTANGKAYAPFYSVTNATPANQETQVGGGGNVTVGGTLTMGSQDTTVTAVVGKIVFQASDSTFYGCRSTVASQKWYPLN